MVFVSTDGLSSAEVETEARVQQPPKIRKIIAGPQGKIDLSGKLDSGIRDSSRGHFPGEHL